MSKILIGSNGLRAGWRLLIFVLIVAAQGWALVALLHRFSPQASATASSGELTPFVGLTEIALVLPMLIAAFIMSKIERRPFRAYGLPWPFAFGRLFWLGALCGFAVISAMLFAMFLFGGFHVTGFATSGAQLPLSLILWALAFAVVGFAEEFTFRGYIQYTLGSGIGFWPAAVVLSALFALAHAHNSGETAIGLIGVALTGLVFCLILQRTGNLWPCIGFHAAFDWGETFFYGVRDSGSPPWHPLLQSTISGPDWLTGGSAGPEASVMCSVAFVAFAVVIARAYRTTPAKA